ncbi:MAG: hypothetical protein IJD59_01785 [Clostridia bacterium]|nr:hypothetical protein [Clostridia bacterium]
MMNDRLKCLRCAEEMQYMDTVDFQLGRMGWLLGDLPHLLSGSMRLSVYRCPACGKVEFFSFEPLGSEEEDHIAQTRCPRCKQMHDMDDPKCPFCGYDYR